MEATKLRMDEKFGGFRTSEGVEITSFSGGGNVDVQGDADVSFKDHVPKHKARQGMEVAILALLSDNRQRQALMAETLNLNNPYLVEVGVEVDPDDGACIPAEEPEDATMLIMVVRLEKTPAHQGYYTLVTMFGPD